MHGRISRDNGIVVHMDMSAQQNTIRQNRVTEDVAVMSDVRIRHQEISIAYPSDAVFFVGTAIDGDSFAKEIIVTDFNACRAALIAKVLWFGTDDRAGEKAI